MRPIGAVHGLDGFVLMAARAPTKRHSIPSNPLHAIARAAYYKYRKYSNNTSACFHFKHTEETLGSAWEVRWSWVARPDAKGNSQHPQRPSERRRE